MLESLLFTLGLGVVTVGPEPDAEIESSGTNKNQMSQALSMIIRSMIITVGNKHKMCFRESILYLN